MKQQVIVKRTGQDNELYHWLKKGEAAEDHKYISREWKNGKWVYTYKDDIAKQTSTLKNNVKSSQNSLQNTLAKNRIARSTRDVNDYSQLNTQRNAQAKSAASKYASTYNKATRDVNDYSQLNTQRNARAKSTAESTIQGYKYATNTKNSVKNLLGIKTSSGDLNVHYNTGYKMGSTKSAALKSLTSKTVSSVSDLVEKGKKWWSKIFG